MAKLTRLKILNTGTTTTSPANLKTGELAYSWENSSAGTSQAGERLYIGTGTETNGIAAAVQIIGGKYFTDLLDHTHGSAIANSAVILDANKHLDVLNLGQLTLESTGGSGQTVTDIVTTIDANAGHTDLVSALAVKSYIDTNITAQDLDITDGTTVSAVDLDSQTLTIQGAANEVTVAVSGQVFTVGLPDDVTITNDLTVDGDLTVHGTTTTVNSTTVTIDDPIFTLGGDSVPSADDAKDRGIEYRYHDGSNAKLGFFGRDDTDNEFMYIADASNDSEVFGGNLGIAKFGGVRAGNIRVGVTGNNEIDTSSGNLTLDSATGVVDITGSLTLGTQLAVAAGGTGITALTDNSVMVVTSGGINFLTSTQEGTIIQFNASNQPIASEVIDGGTY